MRIGPNVILGALVGAALCQTPALAADNQPAFKDDREKASYAIGVNIGQSLKRSGMDVNVETIASAMKDMVEGREPKLNDMQVREAITTYQQEARRKTAEKNRKEGEAFIADFKKQEGVKSIAATLQDGSPIEMYYKVIKEGDGATPGSNDVVNVNYKGTLADGREFDSSAKHGGQPAKFQANRVIRGWTEALLRMKTGSKWEIVIPDKMAYGDFGSGPMIEPGATLKFEVELVGIEAPKPPQTPQPLTSDIIKVPSAEELKKGAKVEVLKPEDVERLMRESTNKPAAKPTAKE